MADASEEVSATARKNGKKLNPQETTVLVVLVVCAAGLILGWLLKAPCIDPEAFDGSQYRTLCYTDFRPVYSIRAIQEDQFPYINGDFTDDQQLVGGAIEYPVLTGVFIWAAGLVVDDDSSFMRISAVMLAPFGFLTAYLLARLAGRRALLFAAAPALVLYAFHNWDLLVVASVAAGLWCWARGRPVWAAVWFGVGAALKLHPILFVLPLALERLVSHGRRDAAAVLGAGAGTALAINLPFMLINFSGWWATYEFHRVRPPNYDHFWNLAATRFEWSFLHLPSVNLTSAALTVGTFIIALAYGWDRSRREGAYPFLGVSAALLAAFMLWNKVHSPQYTLWLLPFFVVLNVHWVWWALYALVDAVVYVGVFRWFYDIIYLGLGDWTPAKWAMVLGVWGRALLLLMLIVVFLRARAAPNLRVAKPVS